MIPPVEWVAVRGIDPLTVWALTPWSQPKAAIAHGWVRKSLALITFSSIAETPNTFGPETS
jgi:hypothetical protein